MKIPQSLFDQIKKRFRKHRKDYSEPEDLQWIILQKGPIEQLEKYIVEKSRIITIQDPQFWKIILETIDELLQACSKIFKNQPFEDCQQIFNRESITIEYAILICNKTLVLISDLVENLKFKELFWSYDLLLEIIIFHPSYDIKIIQKTLVSLLLLVGNLHSSTTSKNKIDAFDKVLIRFHYFALFFFQNLQCLSPDIIYELFQYDKLIKDQSRIIQIVIPSDDQCDYKYLNELFTQKRVLLNQQKIIELNVGDLHQDLQVMNPYTLTHKILKDNQVDYYEESPLFDSLFIRILSESQRQNIECFQLLSIQMLNYLYFIQISEIFIIPSSISNDINSRLIDQKDYLIQLLRLFTTVLKTNQELLKIICSTLQQFVQKQNQLIQDAQFTEKIYYFIYNVIIDQLNYFRHLPHYSNIGQHNLPPIFTSETLLETPQLKIFFQFFQDSAFKQFLKKQPGILQQNNLILQLVANVHNGNQLIMPFELLQHLLVYLTNLAMESSELEHSIISALVKLAKQAQNELLQVAFLQLHTLAFSYKQEYDQVALQNAQQEHMLPLPERYHRLLTILYDERVFSLYLKNYSDITGPIILLLVYVLNEGPSRVRIFLESGELKEIIERIQNTQLPYLAVINFLIAVCSNETAASLALFHKDGLLKKVFQNVENEIPDDFAQKVIMLYSSSQFAKKEIEREIEYQFLGLASLVDIGNQAIEQIIEKVQHFYTYSKQIQTLLQLFERLHPEKRSYRLYSGFEDFQLEETNRQKDHLFNSLLKNSKFVEALEKIIMSPILIGSKNKDQYVEHYVTILNKKGKLNPFTCLMKELKMIEENYVIIDGTKTLDMNRLIDYDSISVYMSGRYFFRKIIKHITPKTYRGFYILSRFHLIHYLTKMCKGQGISNNTTKNQVQTLLEQLLEIYLLSSQHAAFHESVMMTMNKKVLSSKSIAYEEEQYIKKQISQDKLIPIQTSCIDLILYLHQHISGEQKCLIIMKYAEVVKLFLLAIQNEKGKLDDEDNVIKSLTIIQDLMKSLVYLVQKMFTMDQYTPIQFFLQLERDKSLLFDVIGNLAKFIDDKCGDNRQGIWKYVPYFRDAIVMQSEKLIKEIFFRKILLDRAQFIYNNTSVIIENPKQLEIFCNEIFVSQALEIRKLLDLVCQFKLSSDRFENRNKNTLLEVLIERFFCVKDLHIPEMKKVFQDNYHDHQILGGAGEKGSYNLNDILMEQKLKREALKKQNIFEREDIKQIIEMVVAMGFSDRVAKKAIKRIEVPEPTMIIDLILAGKISDDEEEIPEIEQKEEANYFEKEISKLQLFQLIQEKQQQPQQQEQQQKTQEVDDETVKLILADMFPNQRNEILFQERISKIMEDFKQHCDQISQQLLKQSFQQMATQPLNNNSIQQQTAELFLRYNPSSYHLSIIQQAFQNLSVSNESIDSIFSKITIGFGQLALIKRIYPSHYKQLYGDDILQPYQEGSQTKNLIHILRVGDRILSLLDSELLPRLMKNYEQVKVADDKSSLGGIITEMNKILEQKQTLVEALFNELNEANIFLFNYLNQQTNQQVIDRYWQILREYFDFIVRYFYTESEISMIVMNTQKVIDRKEVVDSDSIGYVSKGSMMNKFVLTQCLQVINDFSLHNQNEIYTRVFGMHQNQKRSLFQSLMKIRIYFLQFDSEEQPVSFLENLIYLIGLDNETLENLMRSQLRQAILTDYCEFKAQEIFKKFKSENKVETVFLYPDKLIESNNALNQIPSMLNNNVIQKILSDQSEFQVLNSNETYRIPIVQTTPSTTTIKQSVSSSKQTAVINPPNQVNQFAIRWRLPIIQTLKLNEQYCSLVEMICEMIVTMFREDYDQIIQLIDQNQQSQQVSYRSNIYNSLYSWDSFLKILESLMQKIPATALVIIKKKEFLQFLIKYVSLVAPDKLAHFFQMFNEPAVISCSYSYEMAQQLIQLLYESLEQSTITTPESYFNFLQVLSIMLQMLTSSNVAFLLCDFQSPYCLIPLLVSKLTYWCRFFGNNILKVMEPLLQAQAFYQHVRQGVIGQVFELEMACENNDILFHYFQQLRFYLFIQFYVQTKQLLTDFTISTTAMFTPLKTEEVAHSDWPPWQSKKISPPQNKASSQNNTFRQQQEEEVSDTESEQEIIIESNSTKASSLHSFLGWPRDEFRDVSEFFKNKEEDKLKADTAGIVNLLSSIYQSWPRININLSFSKYNTIAKNFVLPSLNLVKAPTYQTEYYALFGQYVYIFEKCEKKKLLSNKFTEVVLKPVIDYIGVSLKLLMKQLTFSKKEDKIPKNYLNGCLPQIISYLNQIMSLGIMTRYSSQPKITHSYQTQSIAPTSVTQRAQIYSFGFTVLVGQAILNKIPADLHDQSFLNGKLQSLHDQKRDPLIPLSFQVLPASKILIECLQQQDDSILLDGLKYLMALSINSSSFLQFPYDCLRTICKCERVFKKLISSLLDQLNQTKNLKILYILANKLSQPTTKWLYAYAVEFDQENKLQQSNQSNKNPLVVLIELLINFTLNHQVHESFKHPESQIPTEKNLLIQPLYSKSTFYHQYYLVTILKNTLINKPKPENSNTFGQVSLENEQNQKMKELLFIEEFFKQQAQQYSENSENAQFRQQLFGKLVQQQAKLQSTEIQVIEAEPLIKPPTTSRFSLELVQLLLVPLENIWLREMIANDIMTIINQFANDKLKIEFAVKEFNRILQKQAQQINNELELKRNELRYISTQWEHHLDYERAHEILWGINQNIEEPLIIMRIFKVLQGFLNESFKEDVKEKNIKKKDSQATRNQIKNDKKKHLISKKQALIESLQQQQQQQEQEQQDIDRISKKDIKKLFMNVLQTPQTYQLWLRAAETLVLISTFKNLRVQEVLSKKLNPLLECFLSIYQHISAENQLNQPDETKSHLSFFERQKSGQTLQLASNSNLQRTFSAVRENQMQLKNDELFTYICYKGKSILNALIHSRLVTIQQDVKQNNNTSSYKYFFDKDPLGFVFFKMSNVVTFENKKILFEMQLDSFKATDKQASRGKQTKTETLELLISREQRLQSTLEKVINVDPVKFRKSELKIKYQGEKGQDEGGIKREWFTNVVKDILESDKFDLNSKRFYTINPKKKEAHDLQIYKLLGRILGKVIYDGQLVPAYLIPPIFKSILQIRLQFDDLEHFNESYYDSYQKFLQQDADVTYSDLIEFWIPEEYLSILDDNKTIFTDIIQEYLSEQIQFGDQQQQEEQVQFGKKMSEDVDTVGPLSKKQSEDITSETTEKDKEELLEKRRKKRQQRKKPTKQFTEAQIQSVNIKQLLESNKKQVPNTIRNQLCIKLATKIMEDDVKLQIKALREGFLEILEKDFFKYQDHRDLQKLIIGVPQVDIDDLENNTDYVNYTKDDQLIKWFWEVLKESSESEKADFLMFATGSPLVPFGGFKNLKGAHGIKKFTVVKDSHPERLLKAHTCFNRIDLPTYSDKETMKEKIFKSINEGGPEFDLS